MRKLLPYLRLVRVGALCSPAADVVAGMCLCGAPWSLRALAGVLAGVCLYAGGMVLNDYADRRLDAVQRPERPLPRGEVRPPVALALGLGLLLVGCLLSSWLPYHLLMAALVLGYDFLGKRLGAFGGLLMAGLRALNLGSGALLAGSLSAPQLQTMQVAAVAYGCYIAAVTLLGICEDLPTVRARTVLLLQAVPPLAAVTGLWWIATDWLPPLLAGGAGLALAMRARRIRVWDQRTIRGTMTWLLLGTMLYTALLAAAGGCWAEATGIAAAIVPARLIARAIALT